MNEQLWFNISNWAMVIGAVLTAFGTLGSAFLSNRTANNNPNNKVEVTQKTIVAPGALIITEGQTGGQNTVNIGPSNPANELGSPLFDETGRFGKNILHPELIHLITDTYYSFAAKLPDDTELKVHLTRTEGNKTAFWGMSSGTITNWAWVPASPESGEQEFNLDDTKGDLRMHFWEEGTAEMTVYFQGQLLSRKTIYWK